MTTIHSNETIFAPITSVGIGGVSVIRISGAKTKECLKALGVRRELKHREATLCNIINPEDGSHLDEALVIYFQAPNSFTGEEVCELNLHASRYIAKKVMQILSDVESVRMAENGEFSRRAFLNGKIDLTQAEGICDLITSETEAQQKQAMRQLKGGLRDIYNNWRASLLEVMSYIEAYIDFPEEDIPQDLYNEIDAKISNLRGSIAEHVDDNRCGEKIRDGLFVAIVGAPNVGKSSLLNYLANRDVAIVSDIAGTTRDVIEVDLNLKGLPIRVADTAGLRETQDVIEKEGVKRAIKKAEDADIRVAIFNANEVQANQKLDDETVELIDKNTVVVLNKLDLLENSEDLHNVQKLFEQKGVDWASVYKTSIQEDKGVDLIIDILEERAAAMLTPSNSPVITRERHRIALQDALEMLESFSIDKELELAAEDLRLASRYLGSITGQIGVEDILDKIFSEFCIGK